MALNVENDILASQGATGGNDISLPMFNVERVQLNFNIASDFVAGQVANNVLILALATNRILRIDLENPSDIDGGILHVVGFVPWTDTDRRRPTEAKQRSWTDPAHVP